MVPIQAFDEAFTNLEIEISDEQREYLLYVVYQKSEGIEKMRYQVFFDLIEGKLVQGQLSVGSNEGGRKRPESSSPEKLKARNKEKYTAVSEPAKEQAEEDYEDEEFDQLLDKDDESAPKKSEEEDYMDEEQMLDIAEQCFVRIAEAIIQRGASVRQAFAAYILREELEDG